MYKTKLVHYKWKELDFKNEEKKNFVLYKIDLIFSVQITDKKEQYNNLKKKITIF